VGGEGEGRRKKEKGGEGEGRRKKEKGGGGGRRRRRREEGGGRRRRRGEEETDLGPTTAHAVRRRRSSTPSSPHIAVRPRRRPRPSPEKR